MNISAGASTFGDANFSARASVIIVNATRPRPIPTFLAVTARRCVRGDAGSMANAPPPPVDFSLRRSAGSRSALAGLSAAPRRAAPPRSDHILKNVVSADAFGDISGGNIADFLKYLPGLALDLESGEAISVSVRGIGSSMTAVSVDGAQAANSVSQGQSRNFQFKPISMNNASRIELYKVPTPANPADSLGGWRIRPASVLTLSAQTSYYHDNTRGLQWAFNTGANGAPTPAAGVPLSFGEDYTTGATGRGTVTMRQSINNNQGVSNGGSARYRYDDGLWLVTAGLNSTFSKTWRRYLEFGNFNSVTLACL